MQLYFQSVAVLYKSYQTLYIWYNRMAKKNCKIPKIEIGKFNRSTLCSVVRKVIADQHI